MFADHAGYVGSCESGPAEAPSGSMPATADTIGLSILGVWKNLKRRPPRRESVRGVVELGPVLVSPGSAADPRHPGPRGEHQGIALLVEQLVEQHPGPTVLQPYSPRVRHKPHFPGDVLSRNHGTSGDRYQECRASHLVIEERERQRGASGSPGTSPSRDRDDAR